MTQYRIKELNVLLTAVSKFQKRKNYKTEASSITKEITSDSDLVESSVINAFQELKKRDVEFINNHGQIIGPNNPKLKSTGAKVKYLILENFGNIHVPFEWKDHLGNNTPYIIND